MPITMDTQERILLGYLAKFYRDTDYIQKVIIPIVNNKNRKSPDCISLRLIEGFIFKYCRNNKVFIQDNDNGKMVSVYDAYQNQLSSYDKEFFDIFKRSHHILFKYAENQYFETTIGQLNFFRWLIENDILPYVEKNKEKIRKEIKQLNTMKIKHRF